MAVGFSQENYAPKLWKGMEGRQISWFKFNRNSKQTSWLVRHPMLTCTFIQMSLGQHRTHGPQILDDLGIFQNHPMCIFGRPKWILTSKSSPSSHLGNVLHSLQTSKASSGSHTAQDDHCWGSSKLPQREGSRSGETTCFDSETWNILETRKQIPHSSQSWMLNLMPSTAFKNR